MNTPVNILASSSWLVRRFGSKRGMLRSLAHKTKYLLGCYAAYRDIDWSRVERLVFVCKGNICRSAFAEHVAKAHGGIDVCSCGIDTRGGDPANGTATAVAESYGIDLTGHRTQRLQDIQLGPGDLLVTMEPGQAEEVSGYAASDHQVTLLGIWGRSAQPYIQDPYSSHPDYFSTCFSIVIDSVDELAKKSIEAV